jgi:hypothetical protein
LGVREIEATTIRGATSTVLLSLLVVLAAAFVLVIVAVIAIGALRAQVAAV